MNMLAASLPIGGDSGEEVDTSLSGGQLGRENNSRPNLWDQGW